MPSSAHHRAAAARRSARSSPRKASLRARSRSVSTAILAGSTEGWIGTRSPYAGVWSVSRAPETAPARIVEVAPASRETGPSAHRRDNPAGPVEAETAGCGSDCRDHAWTMGMEEIIETRPRPGGCARAPAGPGSDVPEIAWGDAFFYYAPDGEVPGNIQPYGTIVTKDYPDDTGSDLDPPDRWRVNVQVDSKTFVELVGEEPRSLSRSRDHAAADVVNPAPGVRRAELDLRRQSRREHRGHGPPAAGGRPRGSPAEVRAPSRDGPGRGGLNAADVAATAAS